VFNPATGEVIDHVPMSGAEDVAVAVEVASCAYRTWSKTAVLERVRPDVPLQGVAREPPSRWRAAGVDHWSDQHRFGIGPIRMAELRTGGGYDEFPSHRRSQLLIPIASNPTVGSGRAPERSRPAGGE
jgi:Aldehyde dehydrogenase family